MFDAAATSACRQMLSSQADLRFYTTSHAAHDVEAVRRALGYQRINLHGSSYGTRAAWHYAALFPAHTRSMVLHGPAGPGFHLPIPFARGLDVALEGVMAACAAEAACAARFPALRRDVARAFDRLRTKPARVQIAPPASEAARGMAPVEGDFTYGELAEAVRYQLYAVGGARRVPLLLTRAAGGDYTPIAQVSIENRIRLERQLHRGMFMSVTCAEDVPFMSEEVIRAASAGTRLGDYRVRQQIAACREWPTATSSDRGKVLAAPLKVATLVQVGQFDPATPLEWARRAMQLLPNGRLVVVPHGAHGFGGLGLGTCIPDLTMTFIRRGSAKGLDTSCVAAGRRPPFDVE
jgi:pimeloyl-ACP methyl ester carboxylesterase